MCQHDKDSNEAYYVVRQVNRNENYSFRVDYNLRRVGDYEDA